MRPIPAPRLGDTHGLLRAINQRERLRLDEFITEFSLEELFPPGLENALGRTRQFVSFARSAGLLKEDRGTVELTEIGKRYVRAGDESAVFDVAPDQAEWLRRQLRERHMTDSIYHGVAIGLSLYASNPADFHVSRLDFGRALAYLGRAGWDNENTLESQGERYTTFLRDLELVDDESRLTETGTQAKAELTLPIHMSLRDLAGQLNPGGPEAAEAEGEAEWAARPAEGAAVEPAADAEPAPPAEQPAPVPAAAATEEEEEGDEYEDVRGGATAPAEPAAATEPAAAAEPAREPARPTDPGRPVPPSDIWETAAPDETTRAISAVRPEQAAAAAAEPAAGEPPPDEVVPVGDEPVPDEPVAEDVPPAEEPTEAEAEAPEMTSGDPLAAGAMSSGDPLAEAAPADEPVDVDGPGVESAAPEEAADEPGDDEPAADEPGDDEPAADAPVPVVEVPAALADEDAIEPTAEEREAIAEASAGEPVAAADVADAAAAAELAASLEAEAPAADDDAVVPEDAGEPALSPPPDDADATPDEPEDVSAPPLEEAPPAEPVAAPAPVAVTSTREPSGFLDLAAVRGAAEESGLTLPDSVYASLVAALTTGKHLVISGPAGSGKSTLALAVAKAAVQAGRSAGAALTTASPEWSAHHTVGHVAEGGFSQGHVLAAAGKKKWLLIDEIDRAQLDTAFGDLSSFLGGLPFSLPDGSREVAAPADWRIVATRDAGWGPLEASPALLRRFAEVNLPRPEQGELERALDTATAGDATASAAVKRLLAADLPELGAGVFLDAAHHAAERNALSPATEDELVSECFAAYVAPHLQADPDRLKLLEASV